MVDARVLSTDNARGVRSLATRRYAGPIAVRLTVRAHPRSSRNRLRWDGRALEAWVTAPAAEDAANLAVIGAIAEWLDVSRSAVRLVAGHRSRAKVVEIDGLAKLPPPDPIHR